MSTDAFLEIEPRDNTYYCLDPAFESSSSWLLKFSVVYVGFRTRL
jgi:hypothetical protein